jgi:hypothetical protein
MIKLVSHFFVDMLNKNEDQCINKIPITPNTKIIFHDM